MARLKQRSHQRDLNSWMARWKQRSHQRDLNSLPLFFYFLWLGSPHSA
jgi:hypothetical protein